MNVVCMGIKRVSCFWIYSVFFCALCFRLPASPAFSGRKMRNIWRDCIYNHTTYAICRGDFKRKRQPAYVLRGTGKLTLFIQSNEIQILSATASGVFAVSFSRISKVAAGLAGPADFGRGFSFSSFAAEETEDERLPGSSSSSPSSFSFG